MSQIRQVTPLLHVSDLAEAIDRLTRVLRFEVKSRVSGYAYLECENAGIRLVEERGLPKPAPGAAKTTIYIDVLDVDAVFTELKPLLRTLPTGDVHPPINQPWNQREFLVRLPDGNWLAYGQAVAPRDEPRDEEELED